MRKDRGTGEREGSGRTAGGSGMQSTALVLIVLTYSSILSRRIPVGEQSIPGSHLEGVGGTRLPVCTHLFKAYLNSI